MNRNPNSSSQPQLFSGSPRIYKFSATPTISDLKPQSQLNSAPRVQSDALSNFPTYTSSELLKTNNSPRIQKSFKFPSAIGSQTPKSRQPSSSQSRSLTTSSSYQSLTLKGPLNSPKADIQPKQTALKPNSTTTKSLTPKASRTPTSRSARNKISQSVSSSKLYQPNSSNEVSIGSPRAAETKREPDLFQLVTQVRQTDSSRVIRDTNAEEKKEKSETIYREHLFQTFQALKFVKTLPPVDPRQLQSKRLNLSKRAGYLNKKTIVFDLDETLVHCCEDPEKSKPDIILPIVFPTGEVVNAGINIRPYAREVLREANQDFEVIIFTASQKCYADVVIDFIDPTGELVHHRLYRDNCVNTQGIYIKDLRILTNRRLQDIIIVDNAAYSFGYQLDNGIPIISWHDDRYDKELYNLMDYIKTLSKVSDIREVNRRTFRLNSFYDDYIDQFLQPETKSNTSSKFQRKLI